MNRKDKRSRKTVSAIQNTLLQLLCSRRVREIKIVDLCTAADINRTTFYLHYAGITDVLDELRDEITERVFAATDPTTDFLDPQDPLPFLTTATGVFETYPHFADFIRHSQDADVFLTKLKNEFTANCAAAICNPARTARKKPNARNACSASSRRAFWTPTPNG